MPSTLALRRRRFPLSVSRVIVSVSRLRRRADSNIVYGLFRSIIILDTQIMSCAIIALVLQDPADQFISFLMCFLMKEHSHEGRPFQRFVEALSLGGFLSRVALSPEAATSHTPIALPTLS
jgi:hypothetical protein